MIQILATHKIQCDVRTSSEITFATAKKAFKEYAAHLENQVIGLSQMVKC